MSKKLHRLIVLLLIPALVCQPSLGEKAPIFSQTVTPHLDQALAPRPLAILNHERLSEAGYGKRSLILTFAGAALASVGGHLFYRYNQTFRSQPLPDPNPTHEAPGVLASHEDGIESLRLKDGRSMAINRHGHPDASHKIFLFHGLLGSALEHPQNIDELAEKYDAEIIIPSRPGNSRYSSPQPNRTLSHWVSDFKELVAALQIEKWSLIGYSAGGLAALSCADVPGLQALFLVSPLAPLDSKLDWFHYYWNYIFVFVVARYFPRLALGTAQQTIDKIRNHWPDYYEQLIRESPADKPIFRLPGMSGLIRKGRQEATVQGREELLEEIRFLSTKFPVLLSTLKKRVTIFQGDMDLTIPWKATRDLLVKRLSDCVFYLLPGFGHNFYRGPLFEKIFEQVVLSHQGLPTHFSIPQKLALAA